MNDGRRSSHERNIGAAAIEPDPEQRIALCRILGQQFQESPPAVFLWNVTAIYGSNNFGVGWRSRGDEWVIPTRTENS